MRYVSWTVERTARTMQFDNTRNRRMKVVQGRRDCRRSIGHISLPVHDDVVITCLSCAVSKICQFSVYVTAGRCASAVCADGHRATAYTALTQRRELKKSSAAATQVRYAALRTTYTHPMSI